MQNREQSELLAGSPPSDVILVEHVRGPQQISKLKTERIEPQIRTCLQAYKLQVEMQFMNIPKVPRLGKCLKFNPLVSDPRVHSISCPMCRWCLKARGSKKKVELMRKQSRWITMFKKMSEVPSGALQCLPCCGRHEQPSSRAHHVFVCVPSGQIGPLLGSSDTLLQQTVQLT